MISGDEITYCLDMLENFMESAMSVVLGTNKRYFIENKFLLMDCFYDLKKVRGPLLRDWIGLYPYNDDIKLYEPLIFEYVKDHPRSDSNNCFKIRFVQQLFAKFIHCSGKYQFVYVDSYLKIAAISNPFEFVHKNDCNCNIGFAQAHYMAHIKLGQDFNVLIQRLKCLEARLIEYEEGKKEAIQLNEQLVKKLKACEMLRSRGEQFIDGLYNALNQREPVKLTNAKGYIRWIKRMSTAETRNIMMSTKAVKNDIYLTAIINTQEQKIQKLQALNNELKLKFSKYNEQLMHINNEPEFSETDDKTTAMQLKSFTIQSIASAVVKFIDDSEISDDYCE